MLATTIPVILTLVPSAKRMQVHTSLTVTDAFSCLRSVSLMKLLVAPLSTVANTEMSATNTCATVFPSSTHRGAPVPVSRPQLLPG